MPKTETAEIRQLNDSFRATFRGGKVMTTPGILALGEQAVAAILDKVRAFDAFGADNDPHGEHDFGAFDQEGRKVFWKIDYYDRECVHGSENPADWSVTTRVLTVMLAEEY